MRMKGQDSLISIQSVCCMFRAPRSAGKYINVVPIHGHPISSNYRVQAPSCPSVPRNLPRVRSGNPLDKDNPARQMFVRYQSRVDKVLDVARFQERLVESACMVTRGRLRCPIVGALTNDIGTDQDTWNVSLRLGGIPCHSGIRNEWVL
jgi:hypothetical protein